MIRCMDIPRVTLSGPVVHQYRRLRVNGTMVLVTRDHNDSFEAAGKSFGNVDAELACTGDGSALGVEGTTDVVWEGEVDGR